jgi:hypothetical protein
MYVSGLNLIFLFDPSSFYVEFVVTIILMEQVSKKDEGLPAPPYCAVIFTWLKTSQKNPTPHSLLTWWNYVNWPILYAN